MKPFLLIILIPLTYLAFSGCSNSVDEVNEVTATRDTLPNESAYDVVIHYSEEGLTQFTLETKQLDRYNLASPYIEFPKGLFVRFYDSIGGVKSELRANYAISYEGKKRMEARNDVEITNYEREQTLNTEHLIWDQHKHKIFSEEFVRITTKEHIIFGEKGFESDEEFNQWTIRKISGKLDITS